MVKNFGDSDLLHESKPDENDTDADSQDQEVIQQQILLLQLVSLLRQNSSSQICSTTLFPCNAAAIHIFDCNLVQSLA